MAPSKAAENAWFAVDKEGLAQLLARRGNWFAVLELVQNAWDQNVTHVEVHLTPFDDRLRTKSVLEVTDDDPDGFADLTHAYTLFAQSAKKAEAEKRGRFNLGEKLVLAISDSATVRTTKGKVTFAKDGTRSFDATDRTERGSEFRAVIRMNKADREAADKAVRSLIPPKGIKTYWQGVILPERKPVRTFEVTSLATELADKDGNLKRGWRKCSVSLYDPLAGEEASIYEMGIPVVATGDCWHVDVSQKVPLNMDRDNVTVTFLKQIRVAVANEMARDMTAQDWTSPMGHSALANDEIEPEAVVAAVTARFGEKVVSFDMSDPEANNMAVAQGYTVVRGPSLSKEEWRNVRDAGAIKPAGQVTPSASTLEVTATEDKGNAVPEAKWTLGQQRMVTYAREAAHILLGVNNLHVTIYSDATSGILAAYSPGELYLNVGRLGHKWFNGGVTEEVDALLIHEFAHHYASNHLDHSFHDAMGKLGAKCVRLGTALQMAAQGAYEVQS